MRRVSQQIGWSQESQLYYQWLLQLERLVCSISCPNCTTTTTTTAAPLALRLLYNDIANANALVGDASSVTDWNTFFDLPTYGNPFTSVTVAGNEIKLFGGGDITLRDDIHFYDGTFEDHNTDLIEIIDEIGSIVAGEYACFSGCVGLINVDLPEIVSAGNYCFAFTPNVTRFNLPKLETAGQNCFGEDIHTAPYDNQVLTTISLPSLTTISDYGFAGLNNLTTISLPSCTDLGGSVLDNYVFDSLTGKTITLTIPIGLMICNDGFPDGDIQYLIDNNTVDIFTS